MADAVTDHRNPQEENPHESIPKERKEKRKGLRVGIEHIPQSSDRSAPFIGYFPSGYDPRKRRRNPEPPEVKVYRHKDRRNRMQLVVKPKDSNVEFVGKSYDGEAAAPQLCTYAVGILDKETKSLKIVPISANKIFRMEPRVKGQAYIDTESYEERKDGVFSLDKHRERMRELTSLYGSKKNQKWTQKFHAMERQQNDPDSQVYLENQLKDVDFNKGLLEYPSEIVRNLPPYNLAAVTPEEAYPLDKIIPKAEWNHLMDILTILQSKDASTSKSYEENGYPIFVANRINDLRKIENDEKKKKHARILTYITHLVNFLKLSDNKHIFQGKVDAGKSTDYIPEAVFQRFVKLFVDAGSKFVSSEKKELLIYYILVLTLYADNFRSCASDIAKDLKMTHPSLRPYYDQLGCKVYRDGFRSVFTLPVPLDFPEVRVKNKRRPSLRR